MTNIDGQDRSPGSLDPCDQLGLDDRAPDESVEVGDDDDVGAPGLDLGDGLAQARSLLERCSSRNV